MNFSFSDWLGEVTTGHGAMIIGPTLMAVSSGTMDWQTAVPFLAAGVVGLLWPENTALKSAAQTAATNVEALITAYRTGLTHGAAGNAPDAASPAVPAHHSGAPVPESHTGVAVSAIAMLAAGGLALTACANQTPAQQAATETTVASGLLCLADASGKVVATARYERLERDQGGECRDRRRQRIADRRRLPDRLCQRRSSDAGDWRSHALIFAFGLSAAGDECRSGACWLLSALPLSWPGQPRPSAGGRMVERLGWAGPVMTRGARPGGHRGRGRPGNVALGLHQSNRKFAARPV